MSRSKVKGGQGHQEQKTKKCGVLFGSPPLGHSPLPVVRRWENHAV